MKASCTPLTYLPFIERLKAIYHGHSWQVANGRYWHRIYVGDGDKSGWRWVTPATDLVEYLQKLKRDNWLPGKTSWLAKE